MFVKSDSESLINVPEVREKPELGSGSPGKAGVPGRLENEKVLEFKFL